MDKQFKTMPKLKVGWGFTSVTNHEYVEKIVCIYKVDKFGIRQGIWNLVED